MSEEQENNKSEETKQYESSGQIQMVPIKDLQVPETRATSQYSEELKNRLIADIQARGIEQPLTIDSIGGELFVNDGFNRLMAAKYLGMDHVPCIIRERFEDDLYTRNVVLNMLRGETDSIEIGRVLMYLVKEKDYTVDKASEECMLSGGQGRKYMRLVTLDPEIQGYISQKRLGIEHAYQISQLTDPENRLKVARDAVTLGYNVHMVKEAVSYYSNPDRELQAGMVDFSQGPEGELVLSECNYCGEPIQPKDGSAHLFHLTCWDELGPILQRNLETEKVADDTPPPVIDATTVEPTAADVPPSVIDETPLTVDHYNKLHKHQSEPEDEGPALE
jgi:ParB/RepB/Spo0J family partition protein